MHIRPELSRIPSAIIIHSPLKRSEQERKSELILCDGEELRLMLDILVLATTYKPKHRQL